MSKAEIKIEGFVAKDPEIRVTQGGRQVVNVTVPHTPRRKNPQTGQFEDAGETLWVQADFWDDMAATIASSVRKGTLVTITGVPELRVYTRQDGAAAAELNLRFGTLGIIPRETPQEAVSAPNSAQADGWASAPIPGAQTAAQPPAAMFSDATPF